MIIRITASLSVEKVQLRATQTITKCCKGRDQWIRQENETSCWENRRSQCLQRFGWPKLEALGPTLFTPQSRDMRAGSPPSLNQRRKR